jgi:transcriptional regulator with XRE-family HTH domain
MPRSALTGSRIRERRIDLGIKQARLAERCSISPSYLNLIEHNRRRIGGKLLVDLAEALEVEASSLSEGADLTLLASLQTAAVDAPEASPETTRTEEFAGRFPGWAQVVQAQSKRIEQLEQAIEALSDRLTHDPFLSTSLHDVLSTVTAIRSTSGILADGGAVDPEWQARFHRNLYEDSQRLAEASEALVRYLDQEGSDAANPSAPQEELEAWLGSRDFHIAELETDRAPDPLAVVQGAELLGSPASRALAEAYLERYAQDAAAVPLWALDGVIAEVGLNPAGLAEALGADLALVFRRLAARPFDADVGAIGLVLCDSSGTLTFRKPVDGFALPRYGAACPLLPLYQALGQPMHPVRQVVELAARSPRHYLTYAIAQPVAGARFDGPTMFEATMLVLSDAPDTGHNATQVPIGTSCRICPRTECTSRREPSILTNTGF